LSSKIVELSKIKVGAVSYLNTKPLLYGFKHGLYSDEIELVEGYPARIASMLLNNEVDVGLVPVAIIPALKEYHIISDYCIGAEGTVGSVCLFSDVPIEKVDKVLLDYQSRTSASLAKILIKNYWNLSPLIVHAEEMFESEIGGTTAGLVIGDRAFEQRLKSKYVYDLAEAWIAYTGLPFVFAAWISNKALPSEFIADFNKINKIGLDNIDKVVQENPYEFYDLHSYFTKEISYDLDSAKRKGLDKFLKLL
jgi:chorismate dehydratase